MPSIDFGITPQLKIVLDKINDNNRDDFLLALEDYLFDGRQESDFQIMVMVTEND